MKSADQLTHLTDDLHVDVALLQESPKPAEGVIFADRRAGTDKPPRGVAVVSLTNQNVIRELELSHGNGVIASLPEFEGLAIANVHSLKGKGDTYTSSMLRCIDEICEHISDGRPAMIAGDFNCSMDLDSYPDMYRVFERLRTRGFVDVLCGSKCETNSEGNCISREHPRTFKRGASSWRIDHVYVNDPLKPHVRAAETSSADAWSHSDHRPIWCDLSF